MISLKCKICGGEMSVDGSGSLYCDYCGSKYAFRDDELTSYRNFRKQVLDYLRGVHDRKAGGESHEELLWENTDTELLRTQDGTDITIRYIYRIEGSGATVYLTRNYILYVFPKRERQQAERMLKNLGLLEFPPADMKGLRDCFPRLNGQYPLDDGGCLLSFTRPDNVFPLPMFGSLAPEHVAWIVSRLENICCVLEYSGIMHGGITEDAIFINPFTHHAILFGEWWNAGAKRSNRDLQDIRRTAGRVLGMHRDAAPQAFLQFLEEKPGENAYSDFERWDKVIEEGFGGRRFAHMQVSFE